MSDDRPHQQDSAPEQTTAQREYQEYAATNGGEHPATQEHDVLLDVPTVDVDKISLEVDGLRAHVSVLAEVPNLVHLSVGADVRLEGVKLELEGVKAQSLLKVRLEHVRAIVEKALDIVAENPQIYMKRLDRTMDRTSEQVGEAAGRVTEGAQAAVGQVAGQGVPEKVQDEVKATPSAERLAQELGVDLSRVEGTAAGGRITVTDVRSAAQEG